MSTQDALSPEMAERYGAPAPWRRRALICATVVLAAMFLGWLSWTIVGQSRSEVSSELETWAVDDDSAVTAVVVISLRNDDVRASCRLRAYAEDHSTVGELAFTPDPAAGQRQAITIRTDRRAASVELLGCTAPGQSRPR